MRRAVASISVALLLVASGVAFSTLYPSQAGATTTNWDPSGQAMPVGDLPGWHQIFADNFANDSYARGTLTGSTYALNTAVSAGSNAKPAPCNNR